MKPFVCLVFWLSLMPAAALAQEPLPATIVKIKPSIVAVGTYVPTRHPRGVFLGTGFAVGDGSLIATNAHVLPARLDARRLESLAIFYRHQNQEKWAFVQEAAVDKTHDLALLRIVGAPLPALAIGNAAAAREGQLYAFTGFPIGMVLGLHPVTHRGIISAVTPNIIPAIDPAQLSPRQLKQLGDPFDVFQLDATAYPGNSGSPLYHPATGEVVGIVNKVFVQESKENALSNPSGISYAIPANHLQELLKTIAPR